MGSGSFSSIAISSDFALTSIRGTFAELPFSVTESWFSILGVGLREIGMALMGDEVARLLDLRLQVSSDDLGDIPAVRSLFVAALDIISVLLVWTVDLDWGKRSLFAVMLLKSVVLLLKTPRPDDVLLERRD